jgi:hypothetical protein
MAEFQQAGRPVGQDSRDGYPPLRLRTLSSQKKFNFPKKILRPPKKCFSTFSDEFLVCPTVFFCRKNAQDTQ